MARQSGPEARENRDGDGDRGATSAHRAGNSHEAAIASNAPVFVNLGLGPDFDERRRLARNRRSPTPPSDLDKRHAKKALLHSLNNCRGHRPANLVFSHRIINYSDIAFADRVFVHPPSGKIRDAVASQAKMGFLSQTMSSRQRVANIASGCRE
jgi:hypothetical protein